MASRRPAWGCGSLAACGIGLVVGFVMAMVLYMATFHEKDVHALKKALIQAEHLERDQEIVRAVNAKMDRLLAEIEATHEELANLDRILPKEIDTEAEAAVIAELLGVHPDFIRVRSDGEPRDRDFYREHRFRVEIDRIAPEELLDAVDRIHGDGRVRMVSGGELGYAGGQPQPGALSLVVFQVRVE